MVLEVHLIGSIKGYTSFIERCALQCSFLFEAGTASNDEDNNSGGVRMQGKEVETKAAAAADMTDKWYVADGEVNGMTQLCVQGTCGRVWDHPIDVHYATSEIMGWPHLKIQVWGREVDGRGEGSRPVFCGYGFCHCPPPGRGHEIDVVIWRPRGENLRERIVSFFFNERRRLNNEDIYWSNDGVVRHFCDVEACSVGLVHICLDVIVARH
mmetsp:Transcript_38592/g.56645  ORF Transcript_38592/g.56645 Transcript_38592/m.56645 type:complete len:211 (-) Transcript_38592:1454-2086(-)